MQFEVAEHRMAGEFNSPISLDRLGYSLARRTDAQGRDRLRGQRAVEVLSRTDGVLLAVFSDRWRLQSVERDLEGILLAPLVVSV
jgi:peptide chain release factor 3